MGSRSAAVRGVRYVGCCEVLHIPQTWSKILNARRITHSETRIAAWNWRTVDSCPLENRSGPSSCSRVTKVQFSFLSPWTRLHAHPLTSKVRGILLTGQECRTIPCRVHTVRLAPISTIFTSDGRHLRHTFPSPRLHSLTSTPFRGSTRDIPTRNRVTFSYLVSVGLVSRDLSCSECVCGVSLFGCQPCQDEDGQGR